MRVSSRTNIQIQAESSMLTTSLVAMVVVRECHEELSLIQKKGQRNSMYKPKRSIVFPSLNCSGKSHDHQCSAKGKEDSISIGCGTKS